jgi:hypothetical protein
MSIVTALAVVAGGATSAGAAPAGAPVGPRWHGHYGVKAIHLGSLSNRPAANTLSLHSSARKGVVSPKPKVYIVFWGSQWSNDPASAAPALQAFFQGLYGSADTWGTILTQYCEGLPVGTTNCGDLGKHVRHPKASIFRDAWFDNAAKAPDRASVAQISAEAVKAAEHFGNTSQKPNLNAQYIVASPTGTHPDGFNQGGGFCAWHDFTASADGNIAYTNLPYVPDLGVGACTTLANAKPLDGYFSTETHEYAETVTDFWPSRGWLGGGGEIADECVQLDAYLTLSTGTFDVQGLWSNDLGRCTTQE